MLGVLSSIRHPKNSLVFGLRGEMLQKSSNRLNQSANPSPLIRAGPAGSNGRRRQVAHRALLSHVPLRPWRKGDGRASKGVRAVSEPKRPQLLLPCHFIFLHLKSVSLPFSRYLSSWKRFRKKTSGQLLHF